MLFQSRDFNHYISLGYNCQNAFAFRHCFGGDAEALFFNWVYVHDYFRLVEFLKNPDIIFSQGLVFLPDVFMYRDNATRFLYHTTKLHEAFFDENGKLKEDFVAADQTDVMSRMRHLRDKFIDRIKHQDNNLIVCCFPNVVPVAEAVDVVKNIVESLSFMAENKAISFLFIFEKGYISRRKLPKIKNVYYEFIPKFAPGDHADWIDSRWWGKLYGKYRIKDVPSPLSLENMDKYNQECGNILKKESFFEKCCKIFE